MVERFISSFVASDANAAIAGILLLRVENWFNLVPDLLDRLRYTAPHEKWTQFRDRNFSQVEKETGVSYGTLRRLLDREIDEECLGFLGGEDEIFLGIDEHSFKHQELVHTITEVRKRRMLGILRDDRVATLRVFLKKIRNEKVCDACAGIGNMLKFNKLSNGGLK
jgi:hypothetical protein